MDKISSNQMSDYTTEQLSFTNNTETVFTTEASNAWEGQDLYVVYSCEEHFPMYVYDHQSELWFGNSDKYSPTTSRFQTIACPEVDQINMITTDLLNQIINCGGFIHYYSDRCGVLI